MTDYFALLDEPRRPWLDPHALKDKFFARSSLVHPDRWHSASADEKKRAQDQYVELNTAYRCLQDPKDRLAHLIELETGSRVGQVHTVPSETADCFIQISQLCRETDSFLAEKRKQTSPLLLARLFEKGLVWTDKIQELQKQLDYSRSSQMQELKRLNRAWEEAPDIGTPERLKFLPLEQVERIYRTLSYINRWQAQLQERLVQLGAF